MNKKNVRREAAQKKAKKKRIVILIACVACVLAVVVAVIIVNVFQPDSRVFAVADQSVTLYEDGRFSAYLAHNVNISGTFTEAASGNVTEIQFTHGGATVTTTIEDDVLSLPIPWRATCRFHSHEIEFPLER